MREDLKRRIMAYNKTLAERKGKSDDLDIIVEQVLKLPYGQVKKVLTEDVMKVLEKYGYSENNT